MLLVPFWVTGVDWIKCCSGCKSQSAASASSQSENQRVARLSPLMLPAAPVPMHMHPCERDRRSKVKLHPRALDGILIIGCESARRANFYFSIFSLSLSRRLSRAQSASAPSAFSCGLKSSLCGPLIHSRWKLSSVKFNKILVFRITAWWICRRCKAERPPRALANFLRPLCGQ